MMKIKQSYPILLICLALGFLIAGSALGVFVQSQKDAPQLKKLESLLKTLNSEVVPSIISYGKVTGIDGRKITMAFNDDLITVKIKDNASIYNLNGADTVDVNQSQINLSQIKVGDMLNVTVTVDADGNFEGDEVINFSKN